MIKFGTGGWRAVIAEDFTKDNLRLLTAGLCRLMEKEGHGGEELCVGYDRRFLSKESAHWIAEVLAGYGFRTLMVDRSSPTPLIMYVVKTRGLSYGMMVTASHNPAIYNGVKIFTAGGRDADLSVTAKIEEQIAGIDSAAIPSVRYEEALAWGLVREDNPANDYIDSILALVDTEAIKRARLRIALDPMYGVSQTCLRTILMTCRCDVEVIHDRHDTLFGGKLPAPNAATLIPLSNFVLDSGCDLGVATDGDADRLGVIDDSTTHLLDRVAQGLGQTCYEVPVGFKYVSAKMAETDAVIGGESSGGMAVRGHISGKDGIYAAALLTEMLAVTGKSISALYQEITETYGELFYREADFRMTPERKAELQGLLFAEKLLPDFEGVRRVNREDGVKCYFDDGSWVICRFSGTEPLLRMAAEADSGEKADHLIAKWKELLSL